MQLLRPSSLARLFVTLVGLLAAAPCLGQGANGAQYLVHFDATWSVDSHPIDFPNNPHFSPLIAAIHNSTVLFWREGELASPGIEQMAERGQTSPLDLEIEAAIANGSASNLLVGPNLRPSPGSRSMEIEVTPEFPLVTLVSMLAPSPDWFVGVSGLNLSEDGEWLDRVVVTLYPYDAGTDSGVTYTSKNANTVPPDPIALAVDGPFVAGTSIGTFTFVRQPTAPAVPLYLVDDRFRIEIHWRDFVGNRGTGLPVQLTPETGYFWFFQPTNIETIIKVINGCAYNGHHWVFIAGLTNVEVEVTVEDTLTGQVNAYRNVLGEDYRPIQDTAAFANCS